MPHCNMDDLIKYYISHMNRWANWQVTLNGDFVRENPMPAERFEPLTFWPTRIHHFRWPPFLTVASTSSVSTTIWPLHGSHQPLGGRSTDWATAPVSLITLSVQDWNDETILTHSLCTVARSCASGGRRGTCSNSLRWNEKKLAINFFCNGGSVCRKSLSLCFTVWRNPILLKLTDSMTEKVGYMTAHKDSTKG